MLELSAMFADGMILQRDQTIPVWGTADPGQKVTLAIQGKTAQATADSEGNWRAMIGPLDVSEHESLSVVCGEESITLNDIAVGDVYLAGGQSNMEFLMRYEKHFAREKEYLTEHPDPLIRFFDVPEIAYDGQDRDFDYSKVGIWRSSCAEDLDFFSAPAYYFAKELRKELGIPVGIIGLNWGGTMSSAWMSEEHARRICPEQVQDFENRLGTMTYEELIETAGSNPMNDRGYHEWDPFNEFIMPATPGPEEIGAFFQKMAETGVDFSTVQQMPGLQAYPGALYEHMVKPAAGFGVKGALWYQGESDDEVAGSAAHYRTSLETVLSDWRTLWQNPALPFLIVQLPGFRSWLAVTCKDYDLIRRAQKEVCDSDPNAFLCSISDSGEEFDIHPKNKLVVGKRLAKLALRHLYNRPLVADAPVLSSVERDGRMIRLSFDHAGPGLRVIGDRISALSVSCPEETEDYAFSIDGSDVILCLKKPAEGKVTLSFAEGSWYCVNLFSSEGIPAVPFHVTC